MSPEMVANQPFAGFFHSFFLQLLALLSVPSLQLHCEDGHILAGCHRVGDGNGAHTVRNGCVPARPPVARQHHAHTPALDQPLTAHAGFHPLPPAPCLPLCSLC
jgi:hypothetical protein